MPEKKPIEKVVDVNVSREAAWAFLISHERKAAAIDEVKDVEVKEGGARWRVRMPVPIVRTYARVKTRQLRREPPRLVRFEAKGPFVRMTGEHEIEAVDEQRCRVTNRFWIHTRLPGLVPAFRHQMNRQLPRLVRALEQDPPSPENS